MELEDIWSSTMTSKVEDRKQVREWSRICGGRWEKPKQWILPKSDQLNLQNLGTAHLDTEPLVTGW